jgi:adenylyl-sulfate kinase
MNNIIWHNHKVNKKIRGAQKRQKPCLLWFTGLSGSGKSTVAGAVEELLVDLGYHTYLLDGDNVRHGLNKDLGLSDKDRKENIRRIGEMSRLFVDAGLISMSAFISPFREERQRTRDLMADGEFIEIYINTPLDVCELRDPKGLYKKARKGMISNFTGIDGLYEVPEFPDIIIDTSNNTLQQCAKQIVNFLSNRNIINLDSCLNEVDENKDAVETTSLY